MMIVVLPAPRNPEKIVIFVIAVTSMQNAPASRAAACNVQIRRNAERSALAAELIPVLEIGRVRDFGRISHGHGGRRLHRVHIRHGREGCVGIERAVRRFGRIFGVRSA